MRSKKTSVAIDTELANQLARPRLESVSGLLQRLLQEEAKRTTLVVVSVYDKDCHLMARTSPVYATAGQVVRELLSINRNIEARNLCEAKYILKVEESLAGKVLDDSTRYVFTTRNPNLL